MITLKNKFYYLNFYKKLEIYVGEKKPLKNRKVN